MKNRLVIGISGGSGIPIAVELLRQLRAFPTIETHLVMTRGAEMTLAQETDLSVEQLYALADVVYDNTNIGAGPASGTFRTIGMVVVPCSMKTAAGIVSGYSDNLLLRAADVTIKEGRKLVLVARECPLSPIHLRNLHELSAIGVEILPPMLAYYNHPQSIEDCTRHMVGKILDRFGLEGEKFHRWMEETASPDANISEQICKIAVSEKQRPEMKRYDMQISDMQMSEVSVSEKHMPENAIRETQVLQHGLGEGRYRVQITAVRCGKDLSLTITGGTLPHIGASALAVYEPERDSATVSNLTVYTHRDDLPAAKCAKIAAKKIRGTVTAAVGIHIDGAAPQELQLLQDNCIKCLEELMDML